DRCSNDYGFSLLHRSRRVHSHQVSQVNRVFAGGFGLGTASRCDSALSPALRGHRLSFWTAIPRESTRSPGCPRRDSCRKILTGNGIGLLPCPRRQSFPECDNGQAFGQPYGWHRLLLGILRCVADARGPKRSRIRNTETTKPVKSLRLASFEILDITPQRTHVRSMGNVCGNSSDCARPRQARTVALARIERFSVE